MDVPNKYVKFSSASGTVQIMNRSDSWETFNICKQIRSRKLIKLFLNIFQTNCNLINLRGFRVSLISTNECLHRFIAINIAQKLFSIDNLAYRSFYATIVCYLNFYTNKSNISFSQDLKTYK